MPKQTHIEREKAIRMLQANVTQSVIAQQFRCHATMIDDFLGNVSDIPLEQCRTVHSHDVIA